MGYSYPEWAKTFYPPKLPQSEWLAFYATQFPCCEINTTFHAIPSLETILRWERVTPGHFRFAVKAPKAITHEQAPDLGGPIMRTFLNTVRELGPKLGPVLLQYPPTVDYTQRPKLSRFFEELPGDVRYVVELRHASWRRPAVPAWLRSFGLSWVQIDHEDHPSLAEVPLTSPLLYIRLIGKHGRYEHEDREVVDPTPQLTAWWGRLERLPTDTLDDVWVTFNNDYAGHAPATLRRFAKIAGIPLPDPPPRTTQKSLFD